MMQNSVSKIIDSLISNKRIPKFQFERASEPFISFFLPEWLSQKWKCSVEFVVPEFPIKKEDGNQSTNSDFLFKTDRSRLILVELKTETKKVTDSEYKQIDSCRKALERGWSKLRSDICVISKNSSRKEEYYHLKKIVDGSINNLDSEDVSLEVLFITPDPERPQKLPEEFSWESLREFFDRFTSSEHPELWAEVKRLGEVFI